MMIARCTAESLVTGVHGGNGGSVEALGGGSTLGATGTSTFGGTGGSTFAGAAVTICGGNFGQSHVTAKGSGSVNVPLRLLTRKRTKSKQTDSTIADRMFRGDIRRNIIFEIIIYRQKRISY